MFQVFVIALRSVAWQENLIYEKETFFFLTGYGVEIEWSHIKKVPRYVSRGRGASLVSFHRADEKEARVSVMSVFPHCEVCRGH